MPGPGWGVPAVDGASVKVVRILHPTEESATATVIAQASSDGSVTVERGADEPAAFRLVMTVEKDNGEVLAESVRDLSFGASADSAAFFADSRTNSVQLAVNAKPNSIPLSYSTTWADGAASSAIEVVTRTRPKRGPVTVTTNAVVTALQGTGDFDWTGIYEDGFRKLILTQFDANGVALGGPLESEEFDVKVPLGLLLLLR